MGGKTVRDDLASVLAELRAPPHQEGAIQAAVAALRRGDARRALDSLDDLADSALVDQLTGMAQLAGGDPYRAVVLFERAGAAAPEAYTPRLWTGRALAQKADHAGAVEAYQEALRLDHGDAQALAELAQSYLALDEADRAESICRRALETHPHATALERVLASCLVAQARHAEAVQVLHNVVVADPEDATALAVLGRTELVLDRPQAAQSAFEALLRLESESTEGLAGMAEALAQAGDLDTANGYVLRALAASPDRAALQTLHARIALERGDLEQAERAATRALALQPSIKAALEYGVTAALERRRYGAAVRFARPLLELAPGDPRAVAAMAFDAILSKRADQAVEDVAPHLEVLPDEAWLHLAAGCAHLAKRRAETAVAHLIEVVRQREDNTLAQRTLGLAYEFGRNPRLDVARATETLLQTGELPGGYGEFMAEGDDTTDILEPIGDHPTPVPISPSSDPLPPMMEAAVNKVLEAGPPPTPQVITPPPEDRDRSSGSGSSGRLAARSTEAVPEAVRVRAEALVELLQSDSELATLAAPLLTLLQFDDNPLVIAVLGAAQAGKSTFINALVGDALVPTRTTVPYLLRHGRRPAARVVGHDGLVESISVPELRLRVEDELIDPERVARVELLSPVEELTRVHILDVPAAVPPSARLLAQVDVVLWMGAADAPMDTWHDARRFLEESGSTGLAVCTRIDRVEPGTVDTRVGDIHTLVRGLVVDVVAVSAQRGLAALRARDVAGVRASGLSRLHRVLARSFFEQAGALRGRTLERNIRRTARAGQRIVQQRIDASLQQAEAVQAHGERIEDDRKALQRFVEVDISVRLSTGLHEAITACGPELKAIRDAGADHFTRLHQLDALRARVRRSIVAVVDGVRNDVDTRLQDLLEDYWRRWERLFPEDGAGAARVAALHGILDAYRMVALESVFGRHRAYLEGWIDQAPLEVMLDDDAALGEQSSGSVGDMVEELRSRGLRLGNTRPPRLEAFGNILFEALQGFVEETASELRVARVELTQRLVEPLERYRTRGR